MPQTERTVFHFTGHESFTFRYPWLPKAYRLLLQKPSAFGDVDEAMVQLGIGKNMVRSLRFWLQATGMVELPQPRGSELTVSSFAECLFNKQKGIDPFLEKIQTLWLIHWKLSTHRRPLFAWNRILFEWTDELFTRSKSVSRMLEEAAALSPSKRRMVRRTFETHFDVFLHTYLQPTNNVVVEDSLDSPLTELNLIEQVGSAVSDKGRLEPAYRLRRESSSTLSPATLFVCLSDYWERMFPEEKTIDFSTLVYGECSPGRVFQITESEMRERLGVLCGSNRKYLEFHESANMTQLRRKGPLPQFNELLPTIYA